MENCIFCKIINGEIPCFKIREDEKYRAILDIFPNCEGQTLLISKKHYDSDIFEIQDKEILKETISAADKVVALLKNKLKVQRVGMIIEGMGVNHLHIKLYPMHGLGTDRKESVSKEKKYFQTYPGYLTTETWEQANFDKLALVQKHLSL
jgi:histidine triad (HIT) family protein